MKLTGQRIKKDYDNTIRGTQRHFKELTKKAAEELPKEEHLQVRIPPPLPLSLLLWWWW